MPTERSAAPNHEPWLTLWARLVALGWRQETKARGNGRKDQYYIPPHHRQGCPRKLDSRIKVRQFVLDAAVHAKVEKYAAEVKQVRTLLQQAQAKNRTDARLSSAIQQRQAKWYPEDFVPSETDEAANWMLDLFASEGGSIDVVESE